MTKVCLKELTKSVLENPDNRLILKFLRVPQELSLPLQTWENAKSGFDEGGIIFFDKYGCNLPSEVKYCLTYHNLMVIPLTGMIFAAHHGRCTFLVWGGFEFYDLPDTDDLRIDVTLDGPIDARCLGQGWAILNQFCEDEAEVLERAYQLATKNAS